MTDAKQLRRFMDWMKGEPPKLVRKCLDCEQTLRFYSLAYHRIDESITALSPARNIRGKAGDAVREALAILEGKEAG